MDGHLLIQLVVFLGVAAFAAPVARMLKLGSIPGYLLAGAFIGPYGVGKLFGYSSYDADALRHIAELGVAMFLFLIGLELRPMRLWKMRDWVFGAGSVQVLLTGILLVALLLGLNPNAGLSFPKALLIGLALAFSSTAFALLLFQDLAAIPLIAVTPLLAANVPAENAINVTGVAKIIAAVALIYVAGRYILERLYHLLALTRVREAMIAVALLTVAGVSLLMTQIGLSASLGAFLAGVLLSDSRFRHQLEADIEPFEMLLLALFFTTIGMGLNYQALLRQPGAIAAGVVGVIAVKFCVLYAIGLWQRLDNASARRFAIVTSQGGEFAFVVFAGAQQGGILSQSYASTLGIIVTLTMATTPLLLGIDGLMRQRIRKPEPEYDELPSKDGHVVIAGFGRVGQIVARVLKAKGIPFTALDDDPDQVELVNRFGNKGYFGDASRLSILEAAETSKARAFVLAIDDVEKSLKTAELVRTYFPHVPIYARARNRRHVHQLMDLGVKHIERETFLSSLQLTRNVLRGLGLPPGEIRFIIDTFKRYDETRLYEDYAHYTDTEKMRQFAMQRAEELAQILAEDWQVAAAEAAKRPGEKQRPEPKLVSAAADGDPPPAPAQERVRKSN